MAMCLVGLVAVTIFACPVMGDESETVHVRSAIGKSTHSYENATELAVREAVRRAAGVWIDSQSKTENFELLRDSIYTRARGYITRYDVTKKWSDDKFFYVQISADVAVGQIKGTDWLAVQNLIELVGRPDFIVVVEASGQADAQQVATWIRGQINDRIENLGLRVIYPPVEQQVQMIDYVRAINQNDTARAKSLKTKLGAAYGVYVTAFSETNPSEVYGISLQKASVNLQGTVVSRSTAGVLASKQANSVSADRNTTTAVQKACKAAADELFQACLDRIIRNWSEQIDKGVKVELEATALSYRQVRDLRVFLSEVKHVKTVRVIQNDPSGISVIEIRGLVDDGVIADALLEYDGLDLEPQILGPQRVACNIAQ